MAWSNKAPERAMVRQMRMLAICLDQVQTARYPLHHCADIFATEPPGVVANKPAALFV